ncbi:DUF3086 domain-containing protein [Laspinema palackyanum]|uniref:DUF3086 domain-containing protein n=1 Tax=Laspinema palackyanum TaxID=3231601 RepID=UPI00345D7BD9|nr:DUF3086 domain-containing protein [Laspinema sp. D2c]
MNADETHNPEPLETQDKSDSPEPFEASSSSSLSEDSTQGINLSEDLWKEPEPSIPDEAALPLPELTLPRAESQNWEPEAELPVEPSDLPEEEPPAEELTEEEPPEEEPPTEEPPTEEIASPPLAIEDEAASLARRVAQLQEQERELKAAILQLQASRAELLQEQTETQAAIGRLVQDALTELEQRKHNLQISVEQLERRQERIRTEMRTTFAGVSQDLAIRVQGFKDYLSGSLQDLVNSVEQLELTPPEPEPAKMPPKAAAKGGDRTGSPTPTFGEQPFQDRAKQIRRLLDKYRTMPDYYGPPWQVRRTFEPVHAERLSNWFFTQGARGAVRSLGSRLQNILVASAAISVLKSLYGDRLRTLVLANSPERLGEWRRGLQDCLGISRIDFGPEGGVVLFEAPEALSQKADRLLKQKQVPLILIDETENQINLGLLQFPLWLAFAADPELPTL